MGPTLLAKTSWSKWGRGVQMCDIPRLTHIVNMHIISMKWIKYNSFTSFMFKCSSGKITNLQVHDIFYLIFRRKQREAESFKLSASRKKKKKNSAQFGEQDSFLRILGWNKQKWLPSDLSLCIYLYIHENMCWRISRDPFISYNLLSASMTIILPG